MYKVIKSFTDIQDDGHKYNVGDTFPRDGVDVSQARLDKLAGSLNRQGTPLIKKVVEEKPEVKVVPEKVALQDPLSRPKHSPRQRRL